MKTARIQTDEGVLEGQYSKGEVTVNDESYKIGTEATLLAPCEPSVFYCVGRNFADKIDQMEYERPDEPDFFIKPPVSLHPPEKPIVRPAFTKELTYAGELAAVVGQTFTKATPEEAANQLKGFTILNDLDALDQPRRTARKAFDGSAPLGPCIATDLDPTGIDMVTTINGEQRQSANTERMLFDPFELVSFLSQRFTFHPGDVISFGSPENPGLIEPGDEIKIWYEGIGTLRNTVTNA